MDQVLTSHGAFMVGLLPWCGGVAGVRIGLWMFALMSVSGVAGLMAVGLWENRERFHVKWQKKGRRFAWPAWFAVLSHHGSRYR